VLSEVADVVAGSAAPIADERVRGIVESTFDSILVVDADGRVVYVNPAMQRVLGYVLKDATLAEVLKTVRHVLEGEVLLTPALASRLLARLLREQRPGPDEPSRLTSREQMVLRLVAQGATNREIAAEVHLSPGTIKIHVQRILAKLGVAHRTQAAVRALEMGLATG